jgi:hypothetical protein
MTDLDPRYATFPKELGIPQLRWLIENVAGGRLPVEELIHWFRSIHEAIERQGRPRYTSTEEAHLIWDVLWALEFYSPDPSKEENPREWHGVDVVLTETQRAAKRLKEL